MLKTLYFNCTIQELKPSMILETASVKSPFQLHHTGIKTISSSITASSSIPFQLHHTGIKTPRNERKLRLCIYFNCTIQELKQRLELDHLLAPHLFQLHHTGIKTHKLASQRVELTAFQLHHTGIKTSNFFEEQEVLVISIAPYRN